MRKTFSILSLLAAVVTVSLLAGCASTQPNSLTGDVRPVVNDKGVVTHYQAR
jgi:outer membrane murein-binding lipoprotein Lpp